jgi:exosortase A-associated hydrolase 1
MNSSTTASQIEARRFDCDGDGLAAILHRPDGDGAAPPRRGVLIVVGGPQTRVGSHRQFVLLARDLAAAGYPVLRFDLRGMGDSDGTASGFTALKHEIAAATQAMFDACPELQDVVLWGLCDAASAIMIDAWRDPRISGVVLLNPWVRMVSTEARTLLRHYYLKRVLDANFWHDLLRGRVQVLHSLSSLAGNLARGFGGGGGSGRGELDPDAPGLVFPERMRLGLQRFRGAGLLIMSGNDLTAAEFDGTLAASDEWQRVLKRPGWVRRDLPAATHTFSRAEWRDQVSMWTREWLAGLPPPSPGGDGG